MKKIIPVIAIILFTTACQRIKPENLYGKWKYVKVSGSPANPADSVKVMQLAVLKPYIQFTTKDSLIIFWDGSVLSHGIFKLDGHNINYTETLPDGKTRQFPFYISKLTDKDLVFSTRGRDGSEVVAVKQ